MTNTKQSKPLAVKQIKITDIKPAKYNPRKMDDKSFEALVAAIRDYGQRENLIVNKNMTLISGHQRLRAMQRLGYKTAAADVVDLTSQDEKKLNLIMNSPLLQGKFDMLKVDDLLKELRLSDNMVDYRLPELGKLELKPSAGKLSDRFVVAPFSVLNTTSGDWQKRKAAWQHKINDRAETREGKTFVRDGSPNYMAGAMDAAGGGTSILDPVLAEVLCRWFGIPGGATFDPFAGDTVFGYVAGSLGMPFTGIELRKEQANLNQARVDADKLPAKYICDDALNMDKHIAAESQDFIFSCPPYADLEVYSDKPNDLSNMGHDEFFKVYKTVLTGLYGKLKNNRFCAITISEVRNKKTGEYISLVPQTVEFMRAAGFKYYNEMILVNAVGTLRLRVKRQMRGRKVGRMHQNVLVFYKGDISAIKNEYPELTELEEFASNGSSDL